MRNHFYLFTLLIILCSCSKDDEVKPKGAWIDVYAIEGRYTGVLTSSLTTLDVSLILIKRNDNEYYAEIFESNNFTPSHNSDGVTPEVKGRILLENNVLTAQLNLKSDTPVCTGNYEGTGSHNPYQGSLNFNISYNEFCQGQNYQGEFEYKLNKIGN